MRRHQWILALALIIGLPMIAAAQVTTTTTTGTTTQSTTDLGFGPESRWMLSGFVGSNFGAKNDGTSMDVGGSLGYLWKSALGAEFMAGFSPNFELQDGGVLLGEKPQVNSYVINAMGAIPIGGDAQFQPFVSGGLAPSRSARMC